MPRSIKKGPFVDTHLLKKVNAMLQKHVKKPIKTWSRRSMIIPSMIGLTFNVHNGKEFLLVYVVENIIGHRLGEFSFTKNFRGHRAGDKKAKG